MSAAIGFNCQKSMQPSSGGDWDAGNKRMAAILKQRSAGADFLASGAIIINDRGVEMYRNQLANTDPNSGVQYFMIRANLAMELLHSGHTEEAIPHVQALLKGLDPENQYYKRMKSLLAICNLRQGEQQNCIANHTVESCIYPISGAGVYKIREATRMAVQLYTEILGADKDDLQSRWLLNIAYMALGMYPAGVPKAYLIPADHFDSEFKSGRFVDVAPSLGLDVRNLAGGVVMEDFNNDGNLDILMTQEAFDGPPTLWMNLGNGKFADKTKEAGLEGEVAGRVMSTADYDNDGFVDVFICRGAWLTQENNHWPFSLLHNNGNGTFSDVTEAAGMLTFSPTSSSSWADYDHDGFADCFVAHETQDPAHPHPCQLFHNNGNGTFTDVSAQYGVNIVGFFKTVTWGDYNNDGWIDLYVSNIAGTSYLFKNNGKGANGSLSFTDMTKTAGVGGAGLSFPAFFFDYNNDGWPDIFVATFDRRGAATNIPAEYLGGATDPATHSLLYMNNHDGTFTNIAKQANLSRNIFAMSMGFGDIDNDGYPDFFAGTGFLDLRFLFPNLMFRNNAGKNFEDVTHATGMGHLQKGHGIVFGDIDNDGDQDVMAMLGGGYSGDAFYDALFLNPGNKNHWLNIKLEGVTSDRAALGARIHVIASTAKGTRDIYTTVANDATFAAASLQQEIGLGDATGIASIEITWPTSGIKQVFSNVAMDQFYRVRETDGGATMTPYPRTKITFDLSDTTHHHDHMKMP
jgi:hypothetical protein